MKHGFLFIDKPEGPTSHSVTSQCRRALGEKKIGHLGTLDPAATGLMVLGVGKALKVFELFEKASKEYVATITLGKVSSTYDKDGIVEEYERKPGVEDPREEDIARVITNYFLGTVTQVPPSSSAIHIDGERAYKRALRGEDVSMPSRDIVIHSCSIVSCNYPEVVLRIGCSSGTYIRSLAHDLGSHLRTGAYLSDLRRTKVGEWSVEDAVDPEHIAWGHIVPLKDILADRPRLTLLDSQWDDIAHGRSISADIEDNTIAWHNDLPVAILKNLGEGKARARKVL